MSKVDYYRGQAKNFSGHIKNGNDIIPSILRDKKNSFSLIYESNYYKKNSLKMEESLKTVISKDDEITTKTLGKLQHQGFLTRLVDITKNYDVALYFASCDYFDKDGYIYKIIPGKSIKNVSDDEIKSVKRKINTIINSEELINKQVNLNDYFLKLEKSSSNSINIDTITKPVILDYDNVFTTKERDNLRLSKQSGSFILLGNDVDNNILTGNINSKIFDELDDPQTIYKEDKLNNLFSLSKKGINFINLFPDDDLSIKLVSIYNEINELKRLNILEELVKNKFNYKLLKKEIDKQFIDYVDYIIKNIKDLQVEFNKNQNYFYFVFKELVDYFLYFYNLHSTKTDERNNNENYILFNLEVAKDIVERIKRVA